MSDSFNNMAYLVHIRDEHCEVRNTIGNLEQRWQAGGDVLREPEMAPKIAESLHSLHRQLVRHFREEENGGCLEEAVSRVPTLGCEADRLEREHESLLEALEAIAADVDVGVSDRRQGERLRLRFQRFCDILRRHESEEAELLEDAFGDDSD